MKLSTDATTTILGLIDGVIILLVSLGVLPMKLETALPVAFNRMAAGFLTNHNDIDLLVDNEKEKIKHQLTTLIAENAELKKLAHTAHKIPFSFVETLIKKDAEV